MRDPVRGAVGEGRSTLQLHGVSVELGQRAVLSGVDLVVESGVPVAVTGPSGSGKTVLCLVLAGALPASSGRVLFDGTPVTPGSPPVGHVLQHHGLVADLTAEENVALPLKARSMGHREVEQRSSGALAAVGLTDHATRVVDELSGGERQRVGVARAIAGDPPLLVADEPTAELDPDNRARVLDLLFERAATGRLLVVASDDPEVLDRFPRIVTLESGRVR